MNLMQSLNLIFTQPYSNPPPAPHYHDKKHRDKEESFIDSGIFFLIAGMKSPFEGGARFIGGGMFAAIFILAFLQSSVSKAQESFSQSITRTDQFADPSAPDNKFAVLNINGSVTVEAYDGETIELTVKEHLEGTNAEIRRAKEELDFKLERKEDVIIAWLDGHGEIDLRFEVLNGDVYLRKATESQKQ